MSFIEFKHVCKKYAGSDKNTVEDLNLNIEEKEFIAFVGPSGCGKSTTLRMMAGFEEITGGELYIGGTKVNEVAPRDRGIAMVFQNYALYPHMTVEKNIGYGLKNMKMPADQIKKKVDWAIQLLGLEEYRYRKPKKPFRRPAAEGRPGPGHCEKPEGVPYGRAPVQPGRQAPGQHADRRSASSTASWAPPPST